MENVHEKQVEIGCQLRDERYDEKQYDCKYDAGEGEDAQILEEGISLVAALAVEPDEHQARYGEEIEQMDTYGKSHQEADQHYPAVGIWLVGLVVPFGHSPEHKGGEKGRHSIDFAFHCREPECVAEAISQGADQTAAPDCNSLSGAVFAFGIGFEYPFGKEYYGQIKEKDCEGGTDGTHRIYGHRSVHIVCKHSAETCNQLEDRVSWRVTHFEFV